MRDSIKKIPILVFTLSFCSFAFLYGAGSQVLPGWFQYLFYMMMGVMGYFTSKWEWK